MPVFRIRAAAGVALLLLAPLPTRLVAQDAPAAPPASAPVPPAILDSASASASTWLLLVDGGKLEESWQGSHSVFRASVTTEQWKEAVGQSRGPFEPLAGRTLAASRLIKDPPGAPPGEFVGLRYDNTSGDGAKLTETVILTRDGKDGWRVAGYLLQPAQP